MIYIVPDDTAVRDFASRLFAHEALAGFESRFVADENAFDGIFDEEGDSVYAAVIFSSLNESVSGQTVFRTAVWFAMYYCLAR